MTSSNTHHQHCGSHYSGDFCSGTTGNSNRGNSLLYAGSVEGCGEGLKKTSSECSESGMGWEQTAVVIEGREGVGEESESHKPMHSPKEGTTCSELHLLTLFPSTPTPQHLMLYSSKCQWIRDCSPPPDAYRSLVSVRECETIVEDWPFLPPIPLPLYPLGPNHAMCIVAALKLGHTQCREKCKKRCLLARLLFSPIHSQLFHPPVHLSHSCMLPGLYVSKPLSSGNTTPFRIHSPSIQASSHAKALNIQSAA